LSDVLLKLEHVSKRFPGVQALDHVSMNVRRGEVHAVIGENGAGKSTLMRILAGAEIPDEGHIIFDGEELYFHTPLDAQLAGVGIVYQELSVFPNLSIAENILANRQPTGVGGFVNRSELRGEARRLMNIFMLDFEPEVLVRDLGMADRQMVEILRAVSLHPKLLILDEPTSSLTLAEAERLFGLLERLCDEGISVLYVSHQLREVLRLGDRITVLRDGHYIGTLERAEATEAELVHMMVGRAVDLYKDYGVHEQNPEVSLRVSGLTRPGTFADVSFELHKGEILGFSGLIGSGRTDLAQAIFGMHPATSGSMELFSEPFAPRSPREAIARGLAYMPEDRKTVGLFLEMMLTDNVIAPQLYRFSRIGLLDTAGAIELTEDYIEKVGIVARSPWQKAMTLSGGNQQKTLLAMWLALEPQVVIVDEPTRGIDVGAKVEIQDMLRRLADGGMSIMLISSELPEVLTMSDRVAVMRAGRLVAVIPRQSASEESIMAIASGVAEGDAIHV
jgi:ABC-type sugar transport system ATPase subunit